MSDHGYWPDDNLDPDSGGLEPETPELGGDLDGGLGGGLDPEFAEAETADLGGFDPAADDPAADVPAGDDAPPLDPAGDSTVEAHRLDLVEVADGPDDAEPPSEPAAELPPVGADPDLDPNADGWSEPPFPEPLDLDAPEPVDGFPWTDPATLGTEPLPDPDAGYQGAPEPTELAAYAGEEVPPGADPWTTLSASEDPATSSLARWWSPDA